MKQLGWFFAVLSLSGCLQGFKAELSESVAPVSGGSGVQAAAAKSMNSQWADVGSGVVFDLRSFRAPASQRIRFDFSDGSACECGVISSAVGDILQVGQCAPVGAVDPGCSTLAEQYTLSLGAGTLSVCDSWRGCNAYR